MPSQKRQRELARAKWERQQARRTAQAARRRKLSIVTGIVVGLLATAALVWVVVYLVQAEDARKPQPALPTSTDERPSFLPDPTPTPSTEEPTKTQPTKTPKSTKTPATTQGTR